MIAGISKRTGTAIDPQIRQVVIVSVANINLFSVQLVVTVTLLFSAIKVQTEHWRKIFKDRKEPTRQGGLGDSTVN